MSEGAVISISPTIPIRVHPWAKRLFVWCLSFTAFVLSCVAVGSCKFVKLAKAPVGGFVTIQYFGSFQAFASGTCISIDLVFSSVPSSVEAARAFGVLASLFGGIAMLGLLSIFCFKIDQKRWRAIGIVFVICSIFQIFTFIIFNSPNCKDDVVPTKCYLDEGGACSICAMFFYIFSAVGVFLLPVPDGIFIDFGGQPYASLPATSTDVVNAHGHHDEENPSNELEKLEFQKPPTNEKIDNEGLKDPPENPFQRKKPPIEESLVETEDDPSSTHSEEVNETKPLVNEKSDHEESDNDNKESDSEESDDEESEYDEENHSAYHQRKPRPNQFIEGDDDSDDLEDDDYVLSNRPDHDDDDYESESSYEKSIPMEDDDESSSRKMATQASDGYKRANV